jgi:hypothetical protein
MKKLNSFTNREIAIRSSMSVEGSAGNEADFKYYANENQSRLP